MIVQMWQHFSVRSGYGHCGQFNQSSWGKGWIVPSKSVIWDMQLNGVAQFLVIPHIPVAENVTYCNYVH